MTSKGKWIAIKYNAFIYTKKWSSVVTNEDQMSFSKLFFFLFDGRKGTRVKTFVGSAEEEAFELFLFRKFLKNFARRTDAKIRFREQTEQ